MTALEKQGAAAQAAARVLALASTAQAAPVSTMHPEALQPHTGI